MFTLMVTFKANLPMVSSRESSYETKSYKTQQGLKKDVSKLIKCISKQFL